MAEGQPPRKGGCCSVGCRCGRARGTERPRVGGAAPSRVRVRERTGVLAISLSAWFVEAPTWTWSEHRPRCLADNRLGQSGFGAEKIASSDAARGRPHGRHVAFPAEGAHPESAVRAGQIWVISVPGASAGCARVLRRWRASSASVAFEVGVVLVVRYSWVILDGGRRWWPSMVPVELLEREVAPARRC